MIKKDYADEGGLNTMENLDWMSITAGGLAVAILIGGMLMMFTEVWTTKKK